MCSNLSHFLDRLFYEFRVGEVFEPSMVRILQVSEKTSPCLGAMPA